MAYKFNYGDNLYVVQFPSDFDKKKSIGEKVKGIVEDVGDFFKDAEYITPEKALTLAIEHNDIDLAKKLLENENESDRPDINAGNGSYLSYAVLHSDIEMIDYLVTNKSNGKEKLTVKDEYNRAVKYAAFKGYLDKFAYLVEHGADAVSQSADDIFTSNSAVGLAAYAGRKEIIKWAIKNKEKFTPEFDVQMNDNELLIESIKGKSLEVAEFLIPKKNQNKKIEENKADVTARDNEAIKLATKLDLKGIKVALINAGADPKEAVVYSNSEEEAITMAELRAQGNAKELALNILANHPDEIANEQVLENEVGITVSKKDFKELRKMIIGEEYDKAEEFLDKILEKQNDNAFEI